MGNTVSGRNPHHAHQRYIHNSSETGINTVPERNVQYYIGNICLQKYPRQNEIIFDIRKNKQVFFFRIAQTDNNGMEHTKQYIPPGKKIPYPNIFSVIVYGSTSADLCVIPKNQMISL
ncbi:hypothetical protein DF182_20850 [Chitinophaga flava]|uniref:Uncharacterized protein n=1 Tax=Chitinophaga flava TaxID=2259036 RepID=A0A365XRM8_9BACT|nr:hypothetical protein DF182_20850 [Chitinophaga flava]